MAEEGKDKTTPVYCPVCGDELIDVKDGEGHCLGCGAKRKGTTEHK